MRDDNPLLYRLQQSRKRQPVWKKALSWGFYPLLVAMPELLSRVDHHEAIFVISVFLHFAYFCGRPLFESSAMLASERQSGTFESLATTGFSARRWIFTLFSVCVQPRLAELALWGWIPAALAPAHSVMGLVSLLLYSASCIFFYAAVGLWISARSRSIAAAQLRSILFITTTFFIVVALEGLFSDVIFHSNKMLLCQYIVPYIVIVFHQERNISDWCSPLGWLWATFAQLAIGFWLLRGCEHWLGSAQPMTSLKASGNRAWRSLAARLEHPLCYRALLAVSRERFLILRLLGYPAVFLSLRFLAALSEQPVQGRALESCFFLTLFGNLVYLSVRAALSGSLSVAQERESGSWESLLSTRVSLKSLLWGQWAVSVLPMLLECGFWSFLWLSYLGPRSGRPPDCSFTRWGLSLNGLVILITYSLVWTSFVGTLAMWLSSLCSTSAQALRATFTAVMALALGPIILGLCKQTEVVMAISPVPCLVELEGHLRRACLNMSGYALATFVLLLLCRRSLAHQKLTAS